MNDAEQKGTANLRGLSTDEAGKFLARYGRNIVLTKRHIRPLVAFVKKFNSPLLLILIGAAVVSFFTRESTNAVILLLMVTLSVVLDFINTRNSERAVAALANRVVTRVRTLRDGAWQEIDLQWLVPGDVVELDAGSVVPADCRVAEAKDFYVNQSMLTGESLPVEKHAGTAAEATNKPDDPTSVFLGTSVVTGYAKAEILRTGTHTEFGKITERLLEEDAPTDFERGIRQFSVLAMRITVMMVLTVFFLNAAFGHGWFDSFLFAIAIAIGLTPELLPVILSVALSRGAVRMAKAGVIVKHLSAIENFGSMTVLCTDKTGTLTENRISVVKAVDIQGKDSDRVLRTSYINSVLHTGVRNILDDAVRAYRTWDMHGVEKIDELPFDFTRRRESVVVRDGTTTSIITQGAPEAMLTICTTLAIGKNVEPLNTAHHQQAIVLFEELSREGYKVLAVAERQVNGTPKSTAQSDETAMTLLGFIAFLDPPKATVRDALDDLERLGIALKVVTGDGALLTEKICRDVGLPVQRIVSGDEIAAMTDETLRASVAGISAFVRVTPEQKERIITQLRKSGAVVGYLGDGINDATALKAADVGVSVDNAVDVAKETADLILLRKSLRVMRDGVLEGRKTFVNTVKYLKMILSSNFGNMISMTVASAFLPFLPMLPTQVLLNNFLYDVSQLTLTTDHVDQSDTNHPTAWNFGALPRYMILFGIVSSVFDLLTYALLLLVFRLPERSFQTGWFLESIATQVLVIYVIRTRFSFRKGNKPSRMLVINTILVLLVAWMITLLPVGHYFSFLALSWQTLLAIVGIAACYLVLAEAVKRYYYRHEKVAL